MKKTQAQSHASVFECGSCGDDETCPPNECPKSERPCGHHCNHSWSHDGCCWCGAEFGENGASESALEQKP